MIIYPFFILAFLQARGTDAGEKEFTYRGTHGVDRWPVRVSRYCRGERQSPINIDTLDAEPVTQQPIRFGRGYFDDIFGTIINNGHTVMFKPSEENKRSLRVTGGIWGSSEEYQLEQFHFHWGTNDEQGSEHTVNQKRFPLEAHLVHYNTQFSSIDAAKEAHNGLVVMAFFFDLDLSGGSHSWSKGFQRSFFFDETISSVLPQIRVKDQIAGIPFLNMSSMFDFDFETYHLYNGSLTTPDCNEVVQWFVSNTISYVTKEQLKSLRKVRLKGPETSGDNFRFPQPLYNRVVYRVSTENECRGGKNRRRAGKSVAKETGKGDPEISPVLSKLISDLEAAEDSEHFIRGKA